MPAKDAAKVLVVGAGPTGLMAAGELMRRGISCRIVDKLPAPNDKSKALVIHTRTLELLRFMGLADQMLEHGTLCHGASMFANQKRMIHLNFDELESPYPYVLCIPQTETELQLTAHLNKLGGAIERGVEVTSFLETDDFVKVQLRHPDGKTESAQFEYIVGCDGAHSTVRHSLPFTFDGSEYAQTFALADVHIKWTHHDDEVTTFFSEEGLIACFPMGNGRIRIMLDFLKQQEDAIAPTLEEIQAACDKYIVGGVKLSDPVWLAFFKIHRRCSSGYRHGRAFLVGDAAHIHSPVGGQGMNTGMQDAYNLAWKLALVIKGQGTESLLDSYEQERHHVAKALLGGTDMATKVATIRNPIAQSIRNAVGPLLMSMEVIQQRMINTGSMLAVNYRHSHAVGEHRGQLTGMRLDGQLSSWLEFAHGPAPGDRAPDGHVTESGKAKTLFDYFAASINYKLLLFPGLSKQAGPHERLKEVAEKAKSQYEGLIDVVVVVGNADDAAFVPSDVPVLLDSDGVVHHKYGAAADCFYLVRPDGYVGFRSQPPDWNAVEQHLGRLLVRQAVATTT